MCNSLSRKMEFPGLFFFGPPSKTERCFQKRSEETVSGKILFSVVFFCSALQILKPIPTPSPPPKRIREKIGLRQFWLSCQPALKKGVDVIQGLPSKLMKLVLLEDGFDFRFGNPSLFVGLFHLKMAFWNLV